MNIFTVEFRNNRNSLLKDATYELHGPPQLDRDGADYIVGRKVVKTCEAQAPYEYMESETETSWTDIMNVKWQARIVRWTI
jgi:hypothetical protein